VANPVAQQLAVQVLAPQVVAKGVVVVRAQDVARARAQVGPERQVHDVPQLGVGDLGEGPLVRPVVEGRALQEEVARAHMLQRPVERPAPAHLVLADPHQLEYVRELVPGGDRMAVKACVTYMTGVASRIHIHWNAKVKVKKVKKSLFHFSGKSLKVKKVKSESDYFSLSNVCVYIGGSSPHN